MKFAHDWKQLTIAFMGAFSTWAATGFQTDLAHLTYVIVGFISGGLISHTETSMEQNIPTNAHIVTPYVNNVAEKQVSDIPQPTGTDIQKLIQINSGIK